MMVDRRRHKRGELTTRDASPQLFVRRRLWRLTFLYGIYFLIFIELLANIGEFCACSNRKLL